MPDHVMQESPATLLYRLQAVDQAMAQRRARLKEINATLGQNEAVQQAQKVLDAANNALKPYQVRSRDLDLEIKGVAAKMKTTEESLYSGRISNPKALSEMQDEIASLKRHQSKLEDDLLEAMMHSEEEQANVDAAQQKLNEAQAIHAGSQVDMLSEKARLEAELPKLEAQRKEAAAGIAPAMLASYDNLRPKKGGNAVSLMQDNSCMTCRVEQTSSIVQKVRHDQTLVYCAACGRILAPRA
jgi:predicted  nucleic acid-binding Zn-ribbon protein